METVEILIIVKTYPEISTKYTETVCTGGILVPVANRGFEKYQWISAEIRKATSDPRPESYNIAEGSIRLGDVIPPGRDWLVRSSWVLDPGNIFDSLEDLQSAQSSRNTSMGLIRPARVLGCHIENKSVADIEEAELKKGSVLRQLGLFEERKDLEIIPYRFVLHFECDNPDCRGHKISILDWEFGQLYRNIRKSEGWREKIEGKAAEICAEDRDTHLIMGNMAGRQHTFCILGFFYPPKARQKALFS